MMARSTTRSNQKPDTLMQDRTSARSTKPSCNARPDHTLGHFRQIDPLPTLSACPLRSDPVRTFAPQRIDAMCHKPTYAVQQKALTRPLRRRERAVCPEWYSAINERSE